MRGLVAAVLAVGMTLLTSACVVSPVGWAGIGVDAAGRPIGYIQVCSGRIDGATLYSNDVKVGTWEATSPVTGFAKWSLAEPSGSWRVTAPLKTLAGQAALELRGWTRDNSGVAAPGAFTLKRLATLKPGQVYYTVMEESGADYIEVAKTVTEDEFQRAACEGRT